MRATVIIATFLVLGVSVARARLQTDMQTPLHRHYLEVQGGAGTGGLGYELSGGRTTAAPSFFFGAGYTWFFIPSAGFQTGVQLSYTGTTAVLTEPMEWRTWQDGSRLTDYMGEQYTHRASFENWKEYQQIWQLQVPIGLRFRHFAAAHSRFGIHVGAGILLSIPIRANYTLMSGEVTHTGWYEEWRLLLHDVPGRFETEPYARQKEPFSRYLRSVSITAYAEAGILIRLNERSELSVGAYVHWMPQDLVSVKPAQRDPLGFSSERNGYSFMSAYHGIVGTDKTSAVHPWSVGVKAGLSFWPGKTAVQRKRCLCEGMQ